MVVQRLQSLSLICLLLPSGTTHGAAAFGIVPTGPAASSRAATTTAFGRPQQQQRTSATAIATVTQPYNQVIMGGPSTWIHHQPLHYANDASTILSLEDIRLDGLDGGEDDDEEDVDGPVFDNSSSPQQQKKLGIQLSDYMDTVPPIAQDVITKLHDETRANIVRIVDKGVKELNDLKNKLHRDISHPYEHSRVQWDRNYYKQEQALRNQLDQKIGGFLLETSKYRQETHDEALIDTFLKDTHVKKATYSSRGIKYDVTTTPTKEQAQAALLRAKQVVKQLQQNKKKINKKMKSSSSLLSSSPSSSTTTVDNTDERWWDEDDDISDYDDDYYY